MWIIRLLSIIFIITLMSCSSQKHTAVHEQIKQGERAYFFKVYTTENGTETLSAEPLENTEGAELSAVMNSVLQRLSGYFSRQFSTLPQSDVKFELQKIELIETNSKNYRIAVVNIDDPGKIMERGYFQGSTGGKNTQDIILMNILQPHIESYLDGCILLLNNEPVADQDHINLEGIKTADGYSYAARRAVLNKKAE